VDGNVTGVEKVELKKSAMVNGDINTQRIVIEDGAFFKGAIDIRKTEGKVEAARPAAQAAAAAFAHGTPVASSSVPAEKK
jgi:cytoskeletal protein CcmA (bactofilin family)